MQNVAETRIKIFAASGPLVGLGLVLIVILGGLDDQNLGLLGGSLLGLSIAYNLFYISVVTRYLRKTGARNDRV